jgi:hypothetical protein
MGADLYIRKLYEPNRAKYEPLFDKWVKKRDEAKTEKEKEKARAKTDLYYEKMYSDGYFRDSYNCTSLMWQYDLSWWSDMGNGVRIKGGEMAPGACKKLLTDLDARKSVFEANLALLAAGKARHFDYADDYKTKEGRQRWVAFFIQKDEQFKKFLRKAIELNSPIDCSI